MYNEIRQFREACGDAHMKTILAIGELGTFTNVYKASMVAMMAGQSHNLIAYFDIFYYVCDDHSLSLLINKVNLKVCTVARWGKRKKQILIICF